MSAKVQNLRDQVSALQLAFRGKRSLEQQIKEISEMIGDLDNETQAVRRKCLQLCHKIISECFQIANKGRLRFSKQITQQLNELSAATESAVASTPVHGAHLSSIVSTASYEVHEIMANTSSGYNAEQVDSDQLWKSGDQRSLNRASKRPPSSFSMMFSG